MLQSIRRLARSRQRFHALGAGLLVALGILAATTCLSFTAAFLIALWLPAAVVFIMLLRTAIREALIPPLTYGLRALGTHSWPPTAETHIEGTVLRFMTSGDRVAAGKVLKAGQSAAIPAKTGLQLATGNPRRSQRSIIVMCDGPAQLHGPARYSILPYQTDTRAADFVELFDQFTGPRLLSLAIFWACLIGIPLGYLHNAALLAEGGSVGFVLKALLFVPLAGVVLWVTAGGAVRLWFLRTLPASRAEQLRFIAPE